MFFLIIILVYAVDIITKVVVRTQMPVGEEISVLPVFSITHVSNTGVAFGLFQQRNTFFSVIGIVMMVFLGVFSYKNYRESRFVSLVLAGIIGGALGNLTDRLYYGRVTDFLDFYIGPHHWPVFNIADSAICVGAGLLIWHSFRSKVKN